MLATALALALASGAHAHVSAEPAEAEPGAYQVVRFRIGHGCSETQGTTALRIEIPPRIASARPQPKPGWGLAVEHGGGAAGAVSAVVWTGRLPADQFDEFAILLRLPQAPGVLYFPAVQTCGAGQAQWTEIPDPGETGRLDHPAPALRLTPATGAPDGGHHH
ncbi:nuclear export factor GLE1 [Phenylobacterium hankyongense]|uniref:Nuclear export factor GLE1 n=2 Tax=Phenylobacterium hankyongense TaxID=1813876 RepID=A0A328B1Q4_9CAUL|nr:nuclear export factor GLE1 [Phenylobacterium hankyongense]